MEQKKLYRSTTDCMVSGVCGGLGEYLGIPAGVIRALLVIIGIFTAGAATVIIYIVLSAVLPENPNGAKTAPQQREGETAREIMDRAKYQQFRGAEPAQKPFWQAPQQKQSSVRTPDPGRVRQEQLPPEQYDSYTDCGCTDPKLGKNDAFDKGHGSSNADYDEEKFFKEAHRKGGWS